MKIILKLLIIILLPFFIGISMPENEIFVNDAAYFNPEQLDGAFTGGFGEQTCHSCHFDYDLNHESGSLTVDGISETFKKEETYQITVTVESEQLENGGFQMTSRFEDGTQAGQFSWEGDHLIFTPSIGDDVEYVQHSAKGTRPTNEREVSWKVSWKAPDLTRDVIFNIAANAGNDDDSAFGDWIYVKEFVLTHER